MGYEVRTEVFEGPFDLLLRLITAERVDVYEIDLARIVDAYLAEVARLEALDLEVATEFLLIAATLVELKCRRLLPDDAAVDPDEELALYEERDLLLSRLVECKTFAGAARALSVLESWAAWSVPRGAGPDERFADLRPDLLASVTAEAVREAALRALEERPRPKVEVDHVLVDEMSVSQVAAELAGVLRAEPGRVGFRRLTAALTLQIEVVVHFLAILELYKQGVVEIEQHHRFGDLVVWWVAEARDDAGSVLVDAEYRG